MGGGRRAAGGGRKLGNRRTCRPGPGPGPECLSSRPGCAETRQVAESAQRKLRNGDCGV